MARAAGAWSWLEVGPVGGATFEAETRSDELEDGLCQAHTHRSTSHPFLSLKSPNLVRG